MLKENIILKIVTFSFLESPKSCETQQFRNDTLVKENAETHYQSDVQNSL